MLQLIVKICKHHGKLTAAEVNLNRKKGVICYKCKLCQKVSHHKHYLKHKEKVLAAQAKWRNENPEKRKESKRKSWQKHKHKYKGRQRAYRERVKLNIPGKLTQEGRIRKQRSRNSLSPGYIRLLVRRKYGFKLDEINLEMIDIHRVIVKLSRFKLNTKRKENGKN